MQNPSVVVTPKTGGEFKCDLTIEDRPVPEIGDDDVLLEMASVGICGSGKKKVLDFSVPFPSFFKKRFILLSILFG